MISACPDIRCVTIEPGTDEFMVLACDGIWNSKKSQEVVDFVSERIRERGETQLSKICEEVRDRRWWIVVVCHVFLFVCRHVCGSQSRIYDLRRSLDLIQYRIHDPVGSHGEVRQKILDPIESQCNFWDWILDPIGSLMELVVSDL